MQRRMAPAPNNEFISSILVNKYMQRGWHLHLLFFLLALLILCTSFARGETAQREAGGGKEEEEDQTVVEGSMIGSRPPLCVQICRACGRCEAVQVPLAAPRQQHGITTLQHHNLYFSSYSSVPHNADLDYSSNYKPLTWKCKCGDLILNP